MSNVVFPHVCPGCERPCILRPDGYCKDCTSITSQGIADSCFPCSDGAHFECYGECSCNTPNHRNWYDGMARAARKANTYLPESGHVTASAWVARNETEDERFRDATKEDY